MSVKGFQTTDSSTICATACSANIEGNIKAQQQWSFAWGGIQRSPKDSLHKGTVMKKNAPLSSYSVSNFNYHNSHFNSKVSLIIHKFDSFPLSGANFFQNDQHDLARLFGSLRYEYCKHTPLRKCLRKLDQRLTQLVFVLFCFCQYWLSFYFVKVEVLVTSALQCSFMSRHA